jgi:hypothetical protein
MRYIAKSYVEQMLDDNKPLDLLVFVKRTPREAMNAYIDNEKSMQGEYGPDDSGPSFAESIASTRKWIAEQSDDVLAENCLPVNGIDDLI